VNGVLGQSPLRGDNGGTPSRHHQRATPRFMTHGIFHLFTRLCGGCRSLEFCSLCRPSLIAAAFVRSVRFVYVLFSSHVALPSAFACFAPVISITTPFFCITTTIKRNEGAPVSRLFITLLVWGIRCDEHLAKLSQLLGPAHFLCEEWEEDDMEEFVVELVCLCEVLLLHLPSHRALFAV